MTKAYQAVIHDLVGILQAWLTEDPVTADLSKNWGGPKSRDSVRKPLSDGLEYIGFARIIPAP